MNCVFLEYTSVYTGHVQLLLVGCIAYSLFLNKDITSMKQLVCSSCHCATKHMVWLKKNHHSLAQHAQHGCSLIRRSVAFWVIFRFNTVVGCCGDVYTILYTTKISELSWWSGVVFGFSSSIPHTMAL